MNGAPVGPNRFRIDKKKNLYIYAIYTPFYNEPLCRQFGEHFD